ncbi:hypothetical protein GGTG_09255 [Gaeumannomyces tritici R3-111a-1]|uniref:Uncharacterized protein n=1 Tax=Gaeumannomyces tritici (strain R3-111a-1) TaxID=644352 RepID=J3P6W3_GAET3|nr:hypothetical protein GGTG_09255 [Gaeumannomyces tritici R3-111a-1]EJT72389.1 hypothetical protein GGTG_09255 [Gaeumannomyces tritici R3-111a-1]
MTPAVYQLPSQAMAPVRDHTALGNPYSAYHAAAAAAQSHRWRGDVSTGTGRCYTRCTRLPFRDGGPSAAPSADSASFAPLSRLDTPDTRPDASMLAQASYANRLPQHGLGHLVHK